MKKWALLIIALVVSAETVRADEYRDFLSADGKAMRGRVLRFDARTHKVTIERDNKKVFTVPASVFSKEDQDYILEWEFNKVFLSDSSFKIEAQRKAVKDDDESYSGYVQAKKVDVAGYEITLENRSTSKLENLSVEYCIFYEQERLNRSKQLCEQGVYCGTVDVGYLLPKSEKEFMTDSVRVYKTELDADWIYTSGAQNKQDGEVHGIWARVHMKLDSGETLTRDYCLPDSLNNSRAWTTTSEHVGMNSASKKKKKK